MVAMLNAMLAAAAANYGSFGSSGTGMKNMANYMSTYNSSSYGSFFSLPTGCSLDGFVPQFPSGQSQLVAPTQSARFLGLAFGVQNYTCSSSNNYT